MPRPRPTPVMPVAPDDVNEFTRVTDFATQAMGPREFAQRTVGTYTEVARAADLTSTDRQ